MPSRPVLIGRGLVPQTLNQDHNDTPRTRVHTSHTREHTHVNTQVNTDFNTTPQRGSMVLTQSYGGHSVRETPGPIPNPEVKPDSADGTATERLWESRTPPDIL